MESEVSGWVPSRSASYPKLGGCFMRHSMGVKCSRRRLHTETRIYMLKWSNPCECTVRVIEVVEQRRLGLERAGEGWGEVGCEYGFARKKLTPAVLEGSLRSRVPRRTTHQPSGLRAFGFDPQRHHHIKGGRWGPPHTPPPTLRVGRDRAYGNVWSSSPRQEVHLPRT